MALRAVFMMSQPTVASFAHVCKICNTSLGPSTTKLLPYLQRTFAMNIDTMRGKLTLVAQRD
jgi:hypothetical protein